MASSVAISLMALKTGSTSKGELSMTERFSSHSTQFSLSANAARYQFVSGSCSPTSINFLIVSLVSAKMAKST